LPLILKGVILGLAIVLPGVSGGTAFIILGLYKKIINDLLASPISRARIRPMSHSHLFFNDPSQRMKGLVYFLRFFAAGLSYSRLTAAATA